VRFGPGLQLQSRLSFFSQVFINQINQLTVLLARQKVPHPAVSAGSKRQELPVPRDKVNETAFGPRRTINGLVVVF